MHESAVDSLERLERGVAEDVGSVAFPALGEAYRRVSRHADAERVLRAGLEQKPDCLEGELLLCLVLLDQGRGEEAYESLRQRAGQVLEAAGGAEEPGREQPAEGPVSDLSEAELEDAFADAEADRDEMIDADALAREAIEHDELAVPEGLTAGVDSAYATPTMASLLDQQGEAQAASEIRAVIRDREADPAGPAALDDPASSGQQVIETLERWLGNLQRGRV